MMDLKRFINESNLGLKPVQTNGPSEFPLPLYLSNLEEYQKITLKILGLENINIIDANRNRHIIADQIITTEHPWYKKGFILEEAKKLPSWIVKWISSTFLNYAEEFKCNEKIFIDRSESSFGHCQIQINQEIIEFLKKKGFTSSF